MTPTATERPILPYGDAWIEALDPFGLARVPGYDADDPAAGADRWFDWRKESFFVRDAIHRSCHDSPSARAIEMQLCADDPARWAWAWAWIDEPRPRPGEDRIKAFAPMAFQVHILQEFARVCAMPEPFDHFDTKARGLGVSWIYCAAALWAWLFRPWDGLLVSRQAAMVDAPNSVASLFGKVDFLLRRLPAWMLPEGFRWDEHRTRMNLHNPASNITLMGEATTEKTGRGNRSTYALVDEGAFVPKFSEVWGTLSGTTDHRFGVSTESFDEGFDWFEAWTALKDTEHVRQWDYYHNPYFAKPGWLEAERARWTHDPLGFEREVLRDPYAGFGSFVYPIARTITPEPLAYDPTRMLLVSIDPGHNDQTAIVWAQLRWHDGLRGLDFLGSYERALVPVHWYAHLLTGVPPDERDECRNIKPSKRELEVMAFFRSLPWEGELAPRVFMDPAGNQKHNGISFFDMFVKKTGELRQRIAAERPNERPRAVTPIFQALQGTARLHDERTAATRPILEHSRVNDTPDARRIQECVAHYQFGKLTERSTSEPKPIHDDYSHITTAVEFMCCYVGIGMGEFRRRKTKQERERDRRERMAA